MASTSLAPGTVSGHVRNSTRNQRKQPSAHSWLAHVVAFSWKNIKNSHSDKPCWWVLVLHMTENTGSTPRSCSSPRLPQLAAGWSVFCKLPSAPRPAMGSGGLKPAPSNVLTTRVHLSIYRTVWHLMTVPFALCMQGFQLSYFFF